MARTSRKLKTVETSLEVIDALQELDGATVSELAKHLDLAPSTVHGYLSTLEDQKYLVKEGDYYHIGLMFLHRGGYARHRKKEYQLAVDAVETLAQETEERAQFIVEEHGQGIYLHTATGSHAVQVDARIGKRKLLHASAAGKAILAHLPPERVDEILDRYGLPRLTANTITDRDVLLDELDAIRERGYSFNNEESIEGLHGIGTAVTDRDDRVVGSLSVSAPTKRMRGEWFESELPNLLLGTANELELNISYP